MSCTREDILAELVTIGQPISSKSIADRLGKPYYTVSALLSKLYFRGVIGRMTLPDYRRGRAYLYYAKGRPAMIADRIVGTRCGVEQTCPKRGNAPSVAFDKQRDTSPTLSKALPQVASRVS
jgi:hypothetical protein